MRCLLLLAVLLIAAPASAGTTTATTVPVVPDRSALAPLPAEPAPLQFQAHGEAALDRGDYQAALADFDRLVADEPTNAMAFALRGSALRGLERYDAALADFDKAIALRPALALAYYGRGRTLAALDRHREAVDAYDRAIELAMDNAEYLYRRALSLDYLDDKSAALSGYDSALEIDPKLIGALADRCDLQRRMDRPNTADTDCLDALLIDPDFPPALRARGRLDLDRGDIGRAISYFSELIGKDDEDREAYLDRCRAYKRKGRFDAAIPDCTRAIEIDGSKDDAYDLRGDVYVADGQLDAAIRDYSKAILIDPSWAGYRVDRSHALIRAGRLSLAAMDCEAALRLDPDDSRAFNNLGVVRERQDRPEQALGLYAHAAELDPDYFLPRLNRIDVLKDLGRNSEAKHALDELVIDFPNQSDAYASRAFLDLTLGDTDAALSDAGKAIALDEDNAWAHNLQGKAQQREGRIDIALAAYARAIAADPDYQDVRRNRARLRLDRGDTAGAIADLDAVIDGKDPSAATLALRCEARLAMERFDEAQEDCDRALELDDENLDVHMMRAWLLIERGDGAGSLADFDAAIRLAPKSAQAYGNRAVALIELGRMEEARLSLNRSVALDPNRPEVRAARMLLGLLELDWLSIGMDATHLLSLKLRPA